MSSFKDIIMKIEKNGTFLREDKLDSGGGKGKPKLT